jgi:hypothetical protein
MESLLARYLDGELAEDEASWLLDLTRDDPSLEGELRAYEKMLSACSTLPARIPSSDFKERVMQQLRSESHFSVPISQDTRAHRGEWLRAKGGRWGRVLAVAASLAILFGAGYFSARIGRVGGGSQAGWARVPLGSPASSEAWDSEPAGVEGQRVVQVIHVPSARDVQHVNIAGSFNNWDPDSIPMRKEGSVWIVVLTLPPGTYEYMFVENGDRWISDALAPMTRDDGFGGRNAVLDLTL